MITTYDGQRVMNAMVQTLARQECERLLAERETETALREHALRLEIDALRAKVDWLQWCLDRARRTHLEEMQARYADTRGGRRKKTNHRRRG